MDGTGPSTEGSFLARLAPEAAAELQRLGARRRYPAGTMLFREGESAREAVLVLAGEAKVSVESREGSMVILDVFGPGSLLGELSVLDGRPRSASVSALSDLEVLAIASSVFNEFLDRHPPVLRGLLLDVINRLRTRVRHQLEFGTGDALGRLCARLTELADRYGDVQETSVVLRSPVSQSELAAWTGLSREAVVKKLRVLRQLGWIESQGRTITIRDVSQLRQRAAL
jgi:CRP-like cAMP-binding protein